MVPNMATSNKTALVVKESAKSAARMNIQISKTGNHYFGGVIGSEKSFLQQKVDEWLGDLSLIAQSQPHTCYCHGLSFCC